MYRLLMLISFIFLAVGCNPGSTKDQELFDDEVEQAVTEVIQVNFYGESCDTNAPEMLPEGEYLFIINDLGGTSSAELYVGRLTDGHTYQDLLDLQDAPGVYCPKPDWLIYARKIRTIDRDTGVRSYDVELEVGEHAIYVFTSEDGPWFCVPLMVDESTSG